MPCFVDTGIIVQHPCFLIYTWLSCQL